MASVSIRGLDDEVRDRLRVRAARNGRSMEAEMRSILVEAAQEDVSASAGLFTTLLDRFGELGGVDLKIARRASRPRAADLSA
jgi:plasmid stability protein